MAPLDLGYLDHGINEVMRLKAYFRVAMGCGADPIIILIGNHCDDIIRNIQEAKQAIPGVYSHGLLQQTFTVGNSQGLQVPPEGYRDCQGQLQRNVDRGDSQGLVTRAGNSQVPLQGIVQVESQGLVLPVSYNDSHAPLHHNSDVRVNKQSHDCRYNSLVSSSTLEWSKV